LGKGADVSVSELDLLRLREEDDDEEEEEEEEVEGSTIKDEESIPIAVRVRSICCSRAFLFEWSLAVANVRLDRDWGISSV
jgi:hypothetical protein